MSTHTTSASVTALEQIVTASQKLRPRTKAIYLRAVEEFIRYAGPSPTGWTGPAVEAWRDKLLRERKKPQTVNLYLCGLRYASRRLAQMHQDPSKDFAYYAEVLPYRPGISQKRPLTVEEARRLLATCQGETPYDKRDQAIITLGLRTGVRCAGMCSIDLGPGTSGRGSLQGAKLTIVNKGGNLFTLPPLDAAVRSALAPWVTWLRNQRVTSGPLFRGIHRPVLDGPLTVRETPLTENGLYKIVESRAKIAGLQGKVSPHIFRHTCISWLVTAGASFPKIQALTGHKNVEQVAHYAHDTTQDTDPASKYLPDL